MSNILPTVGRVLYFQPSPNDRVVRYDEQPMRADIIYVHNEHELKLHVIDHAGNHFTLASVPLVQEGEEKPNCGYAYWMPYQVGQAKAVTPAEPPPELPVDPVAATGASVDTADEESQGTVVTHQPV